MHLDVWQCAVIETGLPRLSSATWAESSPKQHLCKFPLSFICNLNKITNESHIQYTFKANSASPTVWSSCFSTLSSKALPYTATFLNFSSSNFGDKRGKQVTTYCYELCNSVPVGYEIASKDPKQLRNLSSLVQRYIQ